MDWQAFWRKLWSRESGREIPHRPPLAEVTQDYETPPPLTLPTPGSNLRVGVVSTRGNVRPRNEDNYFVPGQPGIHATVGARNGEVGSGVLPEAAESRLDAPSVPEGLFIVADGMGGQLAGEKASQMAVELIPTEMNRRLTETADEKVLIRTVRDSVAEANREILAQSHLQAEYSNMGTTVALVLFRHGRAIVTNVGDSRVYHLRHGKMTQLTRDHSLAKALEEAGTISAEEVENHKFKNILYLYLGSRDVGEGPEDITPIEYRSGDQFLLATDGLTGVVRDEVIARVMSTAPDPQRAAQQLKNIALEYGSKDNITCVVIQVL